MCPLPLPLPLPLPQVAYSDTFTRLGLRIPPTSAGSFRVTSVRTTVYAGPTTADPVASDRIVIGTDGAAGVGSVTQARTTGPCRVSATPGWCATSAPGGGPMPTARLRRRRRSACSAPWR